MNKTANNLIIKMSNYPKADFEMKIDGPIPVSCIFNAK